MTIMEVEFPDTAKRRTFPKGICRVCSDPCDGRSTYCEEHKPLVASAGAAKTKAIRTGTARVSQEVSKQVGDGMVSIAARILVILTVVWCWAQLRAARIPDATGALTEQMSMNEEEAACVGRPIARLFLKTEGGKRLAPHIVEHEDIIDAAFAVWEWQKRNRQVLDEYSRANGRDLNGNSRQAQEPTVSDNGYGAPLGAYGDLVAVETG